MMERLLLSMLFPILAVIIIAAYAGGLGVIFMVLEETMHNEVGVIVLGVALVIAVPSIAYLIQARLER